MPFLNTDIPELSGFDTGVCLSNLNTLSIRSDRIHESVLAVLAELTEAIIHDAGGDPDTVDSILLSLQSPQEDGEEDGIPPHLLERIAPVNRELIRRIALHSGLYMRLLIYSMIEEKMPVSMKKTPAAVLPSSARGRVAYMPGSFADRAYLRLTEHVKSPRAAMTASFVDACEEVHSGLCEFCILPLENNHSGRLNAFTRLIIRYRLQVVAVCDLENGAAGQTTRFALLREAKEGLSSAPLTESSEGDLLFELLHLTQSPALTELLLAAEFCGLPLRRVDTLPQFDELELMTEERAAMTVACVFSVADGDLAAFRRFLALEAPEDMDIGLYSIT